MRRWRVLMEKLLKCRLSVLHSGCFHADVTVVFRTLNFSFLKVFNLLFSLLTATWRHNMNRNRKLLVICSRATEKQMSGLSSSLIAQICSVACRQLLVVEDAWHHLWWNAVNKKCNYERRFVVWPCGRAAQHLLKVWNGSIICFSYAPIGQNIKTTEGWRESGAPHQHCSVLLKCGFQMGSAWRVVVPKWNHLLLILLLFGSFGLKSIDILFLLPVLCSNISKHLSYLHYYDSNFTQLIKAELPCQQHIATSQEETDSCYPGCFLRMRSFTW